MLMPTFSVTIIGILVAISLILVRRRPLRMTLLKGFLGAWAGFVVGGLLGLVIDITTGNGSFLAYVGHASAVVGAYVVASDTVRPGWPKLEK